MNFKTVLGHGNSNAKLMVIGEAPGYNEIQAVCKCNGTEHGLPFIGKSGEMLDKMLSSAGISRSEVFVDNVVPIQPPDNKIRRLKELGVTEEDFYPRITKVINAIKPNVILALGNTPLKFLTGKNGITKYRGSILLSPNTGCKVVATIHPAFLFHSESEDDEGGSHKYSTRYYMQLDVNRAVQESKYKEYKVPQRNVKIIKDSLALYEFIKQFAGHKRYALDIETRKSIPVCLGIAPNPDFGVSIQLVNIEESDYRIPYRELAEMYKLLDVFLSDPEKEFIGQNFKFDDQKLESVSGLHIHHLFADIMLLQGIVNPEFPKGLDFIASIYTREPYYKDEGREFRYDKDPIDQLFTYNVKDACVTFEAYNALISDAKEYGLLNYFDFKMRLHEFYMGIEAEGFQVNEKLWSELIIKYKDQADKNSKRLQELAGFDINVRSNPQVFNLITKDLHLPVKVSSITKKGEERGSVGEETLVALLGNHAKDARTKEIINIIIDNRRVLKTLSTYLSAYPDGDGRMRTSYRIIGTETGRSSTSKCDPPVRPVKGFGLPFQVMTKHGIIGSDVRKAFDADPGYVIFEADLSQAEARIVALLARDDETLHLFDHEDIHTVTSSWIFGCKPIRDVDNVSEDKRFIGKTCRHAGNYGEGKRKLMLTVNADARRFGIPISISEKNAGDILTIFHGRTPKIKKVFHLEVQAALKRLNQVLTNPFGQRRKFCERWSDKLFREAYAFIPSSTVKDHLSHTGLRIKDDLPGLRILVESHDAFACMVRETEIDLVGRAFKKHMETPIDFSTCSLPRGLIKIPCEVKIGGNYKELKDYKIGE